MSKASETARARRIAAEAVIAVVYQTIYEAAARATQDVAAHLIRKRVINRKQVGKYLAKAIRRSA
jgi:hypothetical protein